MANASPLMTLYRARDAVAVVPTLAVIAILIGAQYDRAVIVHYKDEKKPVEVKLIDIAPPPEQPVSPPPSQPAPPTPQQAKPTPPTPQPPTPQPPTPVQPDVPQVATTNAPSAVPAPVQPTVPAAAAPAPKVEAAPAPAPAVPRVSIASQENEYAAKANSLVNEKRSYPKGRAADIEHPEGTVKLSFTLRRDGSLVGDVHVDESSNSILLDNEAKKTVNRTVFPSFPEGTWVGESTRRFTVELTYKPPGT